MDRPVYSRTYRIIELVLALLVLVFILIYNIPVPVNKELAAKYNKPSCKGVIELCLPYYKKRYLAL